MKHIRPSIDEKGIFQSVRTLFIDRKVDGRAKGSIKQIEVEEAHLHRIFVWHVLVSTG